MNETSVILLPLSNLFDQFCAILIPFTGYLLQIETEASFLSVGSPLLSRTFPFTATPQHNELSPPQSSFKPMHYLPTPSVGNTGIDGGGGAVELKQAKSVPLYLKLKSKSFLPLIN